MNPNYAKAIKEDIDRLLEATFITLVEEALWLSHIVVVPKKNGMLRICVDYKKLNQVTRKDPIPLPFRDDVLDEVARHPLCMFMDGWSPYNSISLNPKKCLFLVILDVIVDYVVSKDGKFLAALKIKAIQGMNSRDDLISPWCSDF